MAPKRRKCLVSPAAVAVMAVALAGCGRVGPLDLPPADTPPPVTQNVAPAAPAPAATAGQPMAYPSVAATGATAPENSVKNGFDAQGNPVVGPGEKKGFFLDFLLN